MVTETVTTVGGGKTRGTCNLDGKDCKLTCTEVRRMSHCDTGHTLYSPETIEIQIDQITEVSVKKMTFHQKCGNLLQLDNQRHLINEIQGMLFASLETN